MLKMQTEKSQHCHKLWRTLASMYSILLSKAVSFSLSVAKRDRHDMSENWEKETQRIIISILSVDFNEE